MSKVVNLVRYYPTSGDCFFCESKVKDGRAHLKVYHKITIEDRRKFIFESDEFFLPDKVQIQTFKYKMAECRYCDYKHRLRLDVHEHTIKNHRQEMVNRCANWHVPLRNINDNYIKTEPIEYDPNFPDFGPENDLPNSRKEKQVQHEFIAGDLVLAKMKGFSWWPSMVLEQPSPGSKNYKVLFFDSDNCKSRLLPETSIKPHPSKWFSSLQSIPKNRKKRLEAANEWYEHTRFWSNEARWNYFVNKKHPLEDEAGPSNGNEAQEMDTSVGPPNDTKDHSTDLAAEGSSNEIKVKRMDFPKGPTNGTEVQRMDTTVGPPNGIQSTDLATDPSSPSNGTLNGSLDCATGSLNGTAVHSMDPATIPLSNGYNLKSPKTNLVCKGADLSAQSFDMNGSTNGIHSPVENDFDENDDSSSCNESLTLRLSCDSDDE